MRRLIIAVLACVYSLGPLLEAQTNQPPAGGPETAICTNNRGVLMEQVDRSVLGKIVSDVLRPQVIDAVVSGVLEALQPKNRTREADSYRREMQGVERELERLTEAIAAGGSLPALLAGLQARHRGRDELYGPHRGR